MRALESLSHPLKKSSDCHVDEAEARLKFRDSAYLKMGNFRKEPSEDLFPALEHNDSELIPNPEPKTPTSRQRSVGFQGLVPDLSSVLYSSTYAAHSRSCLSTISYPPTQPPSTTISIISIYYSYSPQTQSSNFRGLRTYHLG